MAVSITNEKVTVTNAGGDQLECSNGGRALVLHVADRTFELKLGDAQTLCDWMLAKVDEAVEA